MRGGLWGAPKIIYDKKEKSQKIKLLVWHKHIYTSSCLFFFWVCVTFHSFFCLAAAAAAAQLWEFLLGGLVSLDHFRLGRLHNSTRDNNNNSQKSKKRIRHDFKPRPSWTTSFKKLFGIAVSAADSSLTRKMHTPVHSPILFFFLCLSLCVCPCFFLIEFLFGLFTVFCITSRTVSLLTTNRCR